MPHQVTSTSPLNLFCRISLHNLAIKKKNILREFSYPNAGVAWHWNSSLDCFYTAYQQSPQKGTTWTSSRHPPFVYSSTTLMAVWAPGWQRDRQGDIAKILCAKHKKTSPHLHPAEAKQSNSNEPLNLYHISFLQVFMWTKLWDEEKPRAVSCQSKVKLRLQKVFSCQQKAPTFTIYIKIIGHSAYL